MTISTHKGTPAADRSRTRISTFIAQPDVTSSLEGVTQEGERHKNPHRQETIYFKIHLLTGFIKNERPIATRELRV